MTPPGPARTLLTRAVVLTAAAGAGCVLVGGLLRGGPGLVGAGAAVAVVLAFLLLGQVPVAQAARGRRRTGAALLVLLYLGRVLLLVVAYGAVVATGGSVDRQVLGATVLVSGLAWTAGTVWSALRWRPMLIDDPPRDRC